MQEDEELNKPGRFSQNLRDQVHEAKSTSAETEWSLEKWLSSVCDLPRVLSEVLRGSQDVNNADDLAFIRKLGVEADAKSFLMD